MQNYFSRNVPVKAVAHTNTFGCSGEGVINDENRIEGDKMFPHKKKGGEKMGVADEHEETACMSQRLVLKQSMITQQSTTYNGGNSSKRSSLSQSQQSHYYQQTNNNTHSQLLQSSTFQKGIAIGEEQEQTQESAHFN